MRTTRWMLVLACGSVAGCYIEAGAGAYAEHGGSARSGLGWNIGGGFCGDIGGKVRVALGAQDRIVSTSNSTGSGKVYAAGGAIRGDVTFKQRGRGFSLRATGIVDVGTSVAGITPSGGGAGMSVNGGKAVGGFGGLTADVRFWGDDPLAQAGPVQKGSLLFTVGLAAERFDTPTYGHHTAFGPEARATLAISATQARQLVPLW